MSAENEAVQRTASPISSGRSSPIPLRTRQKDDDTLLKRDKGYRRYASTVERVLAQFDTAVEEWADYISFLGRLLKALSIKPSGFADIPHKTQVAKRLSQCLNPKLPSGVHQKTLEVYAYIFSTLGKDGLSTDLGLYLPGLTPILSVAALSVKPNVLAIFETHIVPLKPSALRPALKSILLALLPGLEEENSDEFDRTLRIVNALKGSLARNGKESAGEDDLNAAQYFWQCMFLTCVTSSTRRPGGLSYLTRYLPNLGHTPKVNSIDAKPNGDTGSGEHRTNSEEAIDAVVSPEPGLLIRCFCAGLQDQQPLIQRGFLDLLVTNLPLSSVVLQKRVVPADLERLVLAATSVVARKDMSLNRRLWSWFLGPESSADINGEGPTPTSPSSNKTLSPTHNMVAVQTRHFERCGLKPLARGILSMISKYPDTPTERTRPLRISLSLMDRWEIGGSIVPRIFLPAMQSVWRFRSAEVNAESQTEVLRSANMFFDGVETSLIWSEIYGIMTQALELNKFSTNQAKDMLEMVDFIVNNFNIREEEMQLIHMPAVLLMIVLRLLQLIEQQALSDSINGTGTLLFALKIANRLLEFIPHRALAAKEEHLSREDLIAQSLQHGSLLRSIDTFYADCKGNVDIGRPLGDFCFGFVLLQNTFRLISALVELTLPRSSLDLELGISLLSTVVRKGPIVLPNQDDLFAFLVRQSTKFENQATCPFAVTAAKVSTLEAILSTNNSSSWISTSFSRTAFSQLVNELWHFLSPSRPKHNVEAVRCIWRLYSVCSDREIVDSAVATLVAQRISEPSMDAIDVENARKFTTLWVHSLSTGTAAQGRRSSFLRTRPDMELDTRSVTEMTILERPLMLLLDSLDDRTCSLFPFVVNWLQSLSTLTPIFNVLISRLAATQPVMLLSSTEDVVSDDLAQEEDPDGVQVCLYYLRTIHRVIEHSAGCVWPSLASVIQAEVDGDSTKSTQDYLVWISMRLLQKRTQFKASDEETTYSICQTSLALLRHFYNGPLVVSLVEKKLEEPLIHELIRSVNYGEHNLQSSLMEAILAALRSQHGKETLTPKTPRHQRTFSRDVSKATPTLSVNTESGPPKSPVLKPQLPSELLESIILGLKASSSRPALESWTSFLNHCLPLYDTGIFQVLLPLISCFCQTLGSLLSHVRMAYQSFELEVTEVLDPTIALLLNGLEQSLATAHDVLTTSETTSAPVKSPEPQPSGFFGNMVSNVFASEAKSSKPLTANNRLTVLLSFKDALRICFSIWSWGGEGKDSFLQDTSALASFNYITLRLRNRTRRIFEHLFAAEALECLETLIELWQKPVTQTQSFSPSTIFNLLSSLESSKPKIVMPAIFNAIYSRTNPGALEPSRKSTLTSSLSDATASAFLVAYVQSLDDDAMDEIWTDCITFLKDVLANPMPQRQILPRLIEFTAVLGGKVDDTTFGEQRKVRRELGDLFIRLLTATLTIKPISAASDTPSPTSQLALENASSKAPSETRHVIGASDLVSVLASITPNLSKVLIDTERVASITGTICTQILSPIIGSKTFPENVNRRTLDLVQALFAITEASKSVKREVTEAFNSSKFFSTPLDLAKDGWLQILRSWSLGDKERMQDLLSRLTSPAAAGVLGIGASSARREADRKAQSNLRRIAVLVLAAIDDTHVVNLTTLHDRIIDLLSATSTSSPSSTTRAEIYMVLRALVLKTSPVHLAPLWPTIGSELFDAISTGYPSSDAETPNTTCLLQACKLLDTLLTLGLDDFQMQAWLFVSDTADAFYRPADLSSVALVDDLTEALDEQKSQASGHLATDTHSEKRGPLLTKAVTKDVPKENLMDKVLRPFFRQLSIYSMESTYNMQVPDKQACLDELMADLFDDSTLV